ncbi:MAG: NAD-dependent protein deacylase [Candidatus Omnitrophota bacterium]|nr:NAD-dependent protein deacylase [Candidatus Omnitrophota bacterium]
MAIDITELENIRKVSQLLKGCESIFFITGAGVSADSGLPTYRGIGGLYNDKATEEGIAIEEALSGEMLRARPEITWKYLSQIEKNCRQAKFNRAHQVIAEMEGVFKRVWVLTQNIDGFHYQAGSKNVIEIHGNMHKLICLKCKWRTRVKDYSQLSSMPPLCPECKSVVRPEVVFFGEMLPDYECQILAEELSRGFDIYFSIGTTSVFPYIQQPIIEAIRLKRPTIEINPAQTEVSHLVDIKINLGAAEAMDRIWDISRTP